MAMQWYVVHAYSGFEKSVMRALIERIERAGMQDQFGEILVPVEEVVEMKGGQKQYFRAQVLSRLCPGADGNERCVLAPGQKHTQGHGLCGRYGQQAGADLRA